MHVPCCFFSKHTVVFSRLYSSAAAVPDAALVPADADTLTAIRTEAAADAATTLLSTANASATATAAAGAALNQAATANASAVAEVAVFAAVQNPVACGNVLSSAFQAAHGKNATNSIASAGKKVGLIEGCHGRSDGWWQAVATARSRAVNFLHACCRLPELAVRTI